MPKGLAQGTPLKLTQFDFTLEQWAEAFLIDRKAANLTGGTLKFYRIKLNKFLRYCDSRLIKQVEQIDASFLRAYLIWLEQEGNRPGGVHAYFRTIRAFLRWWVEETESAHNPIRKVKAPRVPLEPLEPVPLTAVKALLTACKGERLVDLRDRAIFLTLLDTGARAAELLAMDFADMDPNGQILIRQGKGRKPRLVFLGRRSRRAVRAYLHIRQDDCPALWISDEGDRLSYWGLRSMLKRRADLACIPAPKAHAFRRSFALAMLRGGVDIVTLARLLGHSNLSVLQRYLKQTDEDGAAAHRLAGPADSWEL